MAFLAVWKTLFPIQRQVYRQERGDDWFRLPALAPIDGRTTSEARSFRHCLTEPCARRTTSATRPILLSLGTGCTSRRAGSFTSKDPTQRG